MASGATERETKENDSRRCARREPPPRRASREKGRFVNQFVIEALTSASGLGTHLCVFDGLHTTIVNHTQPDKKINSVVVLDTSPAHCTSTGKAALAFQDEAVIERLIRHGLRKLTVHTIADPAALRAELAEVRRLTVELAESLELQTATEDILRLITDNPGNAAPVREAALARAMQITRSTGGMIARVEDGWIHVEADAGPSPQSWAGTKMPMAGLWNDITGSEVLRIADYQAYLRSIGPRGEASLEFARSLDLRGWMIAPVRRDREHSLEIELPFLQVVLPGGFQLVPLMLVDQSQALVSALAKVLTTYLLGLPPEEKTLLVASSDLSHFFTEKQAKQLDGRVLRALETMDGEALLRLNASGQGQACGAAPIAVVLQTCQNLDANQLIIADYRTSADVTHDPDSVVGYASAVITKTV